MKAGMFGIGALLVCLASGASGLLNYRKTLSDFHEISRGT
jgi:hypothetical protein